MLFVGSLVKSPRSDNESEESYICPYCDVDKKDYDTLFEHKWIHVTKVGGPFMCYACGKDYESRAELEKHRTAPKSRKECRVHPRDYEL